MTVDPAGVHVDVLLVDDDEGVNFLVERRVRRSGRSYAWCADGESALQFLTTGSAAIVLLDQRLPDLLGHELLERLVAERLLGDAHVALCTAHPPEPAICARIESLGVALQKKADILSRDGLMALLVRASG